MSNLYENLSDDRLYVVRFNLRRIAPERIEEDRVYLCAMRYDPYNKGDDRTPIYDEDPDDAFHFITLTAAEMAAVSIGGFAEPLADAKEDYARREQSE